MPPLLRALAPRLTSSDRRVVDGMLRLLSFLGGGGDDSILGGEDGDGPAIAKRQSIQVLSYVSLKWFHMSELFSGQGFFSPRFDGLKTGPRRRPFCRLCGSLRRTSDCSADSWHRSWLSKLLQERSGRHPMRFLDEVRVTRLLSIQQACQYFHDDFVLFCVCLRIL